MDNAKYISILKDEMLGFVELRKSRGLRTSCSTMLRGLDRYLVAIGASEKTLNYTIIDGWIADSYSELSTNTLKNYILQYTQFSKYLKTLEIDVFVPSHPPYKPRYVPYIFSDSEITDIFYAADNLRNSNNFIDEIQVPMLLRLLYGCGLRCGEALSLEHSDVDIENGVLRITNAKGNKERLVPMDETLTSILAKYINAIRIHNPCGKYLFENTRSGKRDGTWTRRWFRIVMQKAGIDMLPPIISNAKQIRTRNICPNCLRHTFTVNSLRLQIAAGVDVYRSTPLLSIYLGHKYLRGTEKYLHMTAECAEDIFASTTAYTKGLFPEVPL